MDQEQSKISKLAAFLKKNPRGSFSKFALALELLKQNDVNKAKLLFESIREQDPDYLGVYYHLGKLYGQIGLLEQARDLFLEGIELAKKQQNHRTEIELKDALELIKIELNHEK